MPPSSTTSASAPSAKRATCSNTPHPRAARALLPVLDDFERALKVQTTDQEYVKGIELIYQRMFEVLAKLGLEPIEAEGKPFDPNFHHAIEMVQTDEHEDQTVLAELMRGVHLQRPVAARRDGKSRGARLSAVS